MQFNRREIGGTRPYSLLVWECRIFYWGRESRRSAARDRQGNTYPTTEIRAGRQKGFLFKTLGPPPAPSPPN